MQAGTRLDHYEIVGKLGEGGMGAVYRAEDTRLKRQVAIKVLPPELAADPERLARLEREAQLLASLNHPNLATVHGFGDVRVEVNGTEQRVTFLVMELVEGESLYDRAQMGPMRWREVVDIGIGIAAGLEAAHEKGIVHRDLKPANVHLATDGTVKVLDFGLAKAFEGDGASGSLELSASPTMAGTTRTGVILGTAAYMSPEQARGKSVDKRADIWALGCVLYELLAGHKPFDGETVSDILAAILKEQPDLEALPPIPASLRHVLERSLEKYPAQRMRDVGDVRLELEAARLEEPRTGAGAVAAGSGVSWKIAAALAVAAALLAAAATYALRGGAPPAPEARVILSTEGLSSGPLPLAISPDARWIAETDFATGVRLRAMDEIAWRTLPGSSGAGSVAFSANSRQGWFIKGGQNTAPQLYRFDLDGSSPVLVASLDIGFAGVFRGLADTIYVGSITPTGSALHRLESNATLTEIFREEAPEVVTLFTAQADETHWLGFQLSGSAVQGLALLDGEGATITALLPGYRSPVSLGDGRLLAVDEQGRLVSARINLSDATILDPPAVRLEGLSLSSGVAGAYSIADDGTFVFMAGESGSGDEQRLAWLSPDGDIEYFSSRATRYQVDTFPSPDGTRIAAELDDIGNGNVTIHVHEIERDISAPLVPGSYSTFPVWSPDSAQIAYHLTSSEAPGIYRAPIDRSELPELLLPEPDGSFFLPMDWSPDGSLLLYVDSTSNTRAASSERNDLWILPLDGREPYPLLATAAAEVDGRFSPDGRWVAYVSHQSAGPEVYVRALEGGGEYQMSANGGYSPEWSPDGTRLYFLRRSEIMAVDIDASGATPNVSAERPVVQLPGTRFRTDLYAPAADGERFLVAAYNRADSAERAIHAIFNWPLLDELRR